MVIKRENIVLGLIDYQKQDILIPFIYGTVINASIFYLSIFNWLILKFPKNIFLRRLLVSFVILFLLTWLETGIDMYFVVPERMQELERSGATPYLVNLVLNIIFLILAFTYRYIKDWFITEQQKRVLNEEKLKYEHDFLKSQINPHFLFNSLNNLFSLAHEENAERTADSIAKLSRLMRYILYGSDRDGVELKKDLEHMNDYIQLQKMRLANDREITIEYSVEGDIESKYITPALFLPLVENAFKHGISYQKKSRIVISVILIKNDLTFQVKNYIHKKDHNDLYSGIGLKNLKKRLQLIYPNRHEFEIRNENDMFEVCLKIKGLM